jgi:hypothetical protein
MFWGWNLLENKIALPVPWLPILSFIEDTCSPACLAASSASLQAEQSAYFSKFSNTRHIQTGIYTSRTTTAISNRCTYICVSNMYTLEQPPYPTGSTDIKLQATISNGLYTYLQVTTFWCTFWNSHHIQWKVRIFCRYASNTTYWQVRSAYYLVFLFFWCILFRILMQGMYICRYVSFDVHWRHAITYKCLLTYIVTYLQGNACRHICRYVYVSLETLFDTCRYIYSLWLNLSKEKETTCIIRNTIWCMLSNNTLQQHICRYVYSDTYIHFDLNLSI